MYDSWVVTMRALSRELRMTLRQIRFSSRPCRFLTIVSRRTGWPSVPEILNLSTQNHVDSVRPDCEGNTRSPAEITKQAGHIQNISWAWLAILQIIKKNPNTNWIKKNCNLCFGFKTTILKSITFIIRDSLVYKSGLSWVNGPCS